MFNFNITKLIGEMSFKSEVSTQENRFEENKFTISMAVLSVIFFIFGLIGNTVVIFIISVLKEHKKSSTKRYILQLAVANLLFLLTIPFDVSQNLKNEWTFPEWMCKAKKTVLSFNYYASIMFLMVMSFDRYVAVCKPTSNLKHKLQSVKVSLIISAVVWIVALVFTIPVMMYSFKTGQDPSCTCEYHFPSNEDPCLNEKITNDTLAYEVCLLFSTKHCTTKEDISGFPKFFDSYDKVNFGASSGEASGTYPDVDDDGENKQYLNPGCFYNQKSTLFLAYIWFDFAAMFLFPLLVMIICYGLIIKRIFVSRRRIRTRLSSFSSISRRETFVPSAFGDDEYLKRITKMCATLVSSFVVCWILYQAFRIAKINGIHNVETEVCEKISEVGSLLVFFNAALNPYLYSFMGMDFKSRCRKAITSVRSSVSKGRTSSSSSFKGNSKARTRLNSRTQQAVLPSNSKNSTLPRKMNQDSPSMAVTNFPQRIESSSGSRTRYHSERNVELTTPAKNPVLKTSKSQEDPESSV